MTFFLIHAMNDRMDIQLPSPKEIKNAFPLSSKDMHFIEKSRDQAKQIFFEIDKRFIIILGPCSIHHPESVLKYAEYLSETAKNSSDRCFLIMRAYVEKPRTRGGWKGLVYDPDLDGSYDLRQGLFEARKTLVALTQKKIPLAMEFLDPLLSLYFDDLITWGFIGARTSASQIHRQLASNLSFPIGFKNTVEGCIDTAINGIITSNLPHVFFGIDENGYISRKKSLGNPMTHLVLRGSNQMTNYQEESVQEAIQKLDQYDIPKRILIDCAHGNCQKDFRKQQTAFFSVMEQLEESKHAIIGVMLESYLKEGNYPFREGDSDPAPDISITDGCIDWETTEKLIMWAYDKSQYVKI